MKRLKQVWIWTDRLFFHTKKWKKKNLKVKKYFKWMKRKDQKKILIQNKTFKTSLNWTEDYFSIQKKWKKKI